MTIVCFYKLNSLFYLVDVSQVNFDLLIFILNYSPLSTTLYQDKFVKINHCNLSFNWLNSTYILKLVFNCFLSTNLKHF